jgi:hypothetical protein
VLPGDLLILLVFLGLILAYSGFLSLFINAGFDLWGGFGWWIEKAGIFGILATIIVYWLQQRNDSLKREKEERDRMRNSYDALRTELEDHRDAFNKDAHPDDVIKVGENEWYVSRALVTDAYDSLLYSGLFSHLKKDTQNDLSNLYLSIRNQNELLEYMRRFRDSFFMDGNYADKEGKWQEKIKPYYEFIAETQRAIIDDLEDIETKINEAVSALKQKETTG